MGFKNPPPVDDDYVRPPLVPGVPGAVSPLVRRVVAPSAICATEPGANAYLVGIDEVVVVDPGPNVVAHLETLVRAAVVERLTAVVLTDVTPEHAAGAEHLATLAEIPILAADRRHAATRVDRLLGEGDTIDGTEFRLEVVSTPGLRPNQICLLLEEERLVFTGDTVLEGAQPVLSPKGGADLADYLASLDRIGRLRPRKFAPGSGYVIDDPMAWLGDCHAHWTNSEADILAALAEGPAKIVELVDRLHPQLRDDERAAAGDIVHTHLLKLKAEGRVAGRAARESWRTAA